MADDIAQHVSVKLLTRIGQFRQEAEFTTWLDRIVASTSTHYRRAHGLFVPVKSAPNPRCAFHACAVAFG